MNLIIYLRDQLLDQERGDNALSKVLYHCMT